MFAQVFSFDYDPAQPDSLMQLFNQVVAQDLQRQPGFKSAQNLVDPQSGHWIGISYWGSEAEARTATEVALNPPPPPPGVTVPAVKGVSAKVYEVVS